MDLTKIVIIGAIIVFILGVLLPSIAIVLCYDKKERFNGRFFQWIWRMFIEQKEVCGVESIIVVPDPCDKHEETANESPKTSSVKLRLGADNGAKVVVRVYRKRPNSGVLLEDFASEEICDVREMLRVSHARASSIPRRNASMASHKQQDNTEAMIAAH